LAALCSSNPSGMSFSRRVIFPWCVTGLAVSARDRLVQKIPIGRQGQKRPAVPVHVVLEIEYLWKSCAGCFVFGPGTIGVLGTDKIINSPLDAGSFRLFKGAQAHDRPGCL